VPRTTRYEEPARRLPTWEPPSLAQATRYSGASIRHTTGRPLTLDQAHDKIRAALARAVETPRAQWSWGILHESDLIGLISLRRRTPVMGTISYILREDSWGNGYATHAAHQVVTAAFTTAGLNRLEAMHHPDNPASGRVHRSLPRLHAAAVLHDSIVSQALAKPHKAPPFTMPGELVRQATGRTWPSWQQLARSSGWNDYDGYRPDPPDRP
jgi:ribosomal-protein-alanine N-acetyltransferase